MAKGPATGTTDGDRAWLHEKLMQAVRRVVRNASETLVGFTADAETGLNCDEINKSAREIGLIAPGEFIIERRKTTEDGGEVETVVVRHPDARRTPVKIQVVGPSRPSLREVVALADDVVHYLRAWAERCEQEPPEEQSLGSREVGETPAHQPGPLPTPIVGVAVNLGDVLDTAGWLRANVALLERACAADELPEDLRRSSFPDPGAILRQEEADRLQGRPGWNEAVHAIRATRQLRRSIPPLLDTLPTISTWVDDTTNPAQERWTVVVAADLRRLNGCAHRGQPRDPFPSDLPWLDQGVADALGEVLERLEERWNQLQAIKRSRATPISLTPGSLSLYSGVLDASEAAAVIQLGERTIWGVDELPETIDADMLRCLDRHGMVQARVVLMQNQSKHLGDCTPPKPSPQEWFSPIQQPKVAGDWDAVMAWHVRDSRQHPSQIRLSDVGKAERAKVLRTAGGSAGGDPGGPAADTTAAGGEAGGHYEDPTESVAKNDLDGITDTTFLSESDLADRFKVRQSTLRGRLPTWRKSHMNNDWIPVTDRRPKDPHFLYRVLSIYPLIEEIRRSQRGSA